jgi:hypothetical protein
MLDPSDYKSAADALGCEVAAVKAVDRVESGGAGFLPNGQPKILFEAHLFSRLTGHKYDATHPGISSPSWNRKLYRGGAAEHDRLAEAVALDRNAALQSASWGRYQILGSNWRECGYPSLQSFINAMYESERDHLAAFVGFVKHRGLADELQRRDWAGFAKAYNGPGYLNNRYDTKLEQAYSQYVRENA